MITTDAIRSVPSPHHRYEDRSRMIGQDHPRAALAGRGHLYAVMDGVGGAPLGMRAAQLLADRLPAFVEPDRSPATAAALAALVASVNDEAHAWGLIDGTDRPLAGAAATVAWLDPHARRLHVLHVGDTAAYRFDGETLHPLTREHGSGRSLTRYLGQGAGFRLDRTDVALEEGETLLLCSDGVTRALRVHDLRDVLAALPDPARAAAEIVSRARSRGSQDDITALVVELEEW